MRWSQIKHLTISAIYNSPSIWKPPGHWTKIKVFQCVVTFRTGADLRLCMITSADVRPGTVRQDCKNSQKQIKVHVESQPSAVRLISSSGARTVIVRWPGRQSLVPGRLLFGARTGIGRYVEFFRSLLMECFTHRKVDLRIQTCNNCADSDANKCVL